MSQEALKALQQIPGVGKVIAQDLWNLGIRDVKDLEDQDPETIYLRLCHQQGTQVDRCMLYVFRYAIYYATTEEPEADLLKWWNWSDQNLAK